MSESTVNAIITAVGSLLGGIIGAYATIQAAKIKLPKSPNDTEFKFPLLGIILGAIIGAVATLAVLAFLGFVPPKEPSSSPTASASPAPSSTLPTPTGKILFSDNFDNGYADGFTFQSGDWKVVDDGTGNKVLQMSGPSTCCAEALFGPSNLANGIIELRYKVISADSQAEHHVATFGFRLQTTNGNFTNYWLIYEPMGSNLSLVYQENGGAWQPVERSSGGGSIQTQEGNWVTLRVEFQGENIKVYVNGNPFMNAQDSRDKEGALILGANGPVTVQFDDLKVWEVPK